MWIHRGQEMIKKHREWMAVPYHGMSWPPCPTREAYLDVQEALRNNRRPKPRDVQFLERIPPLLPPPKMGAG